MALAEIQLDPNKVRYLVGDTVSGTARVVLPSHIPPCAIVVSFRCLGEVKWIEDPGTMYYLNGRVYTDKIDYHVEELKWNLKGMCEVIAVTLSYNLFYGIDYKLYISNYRCHY